MGSTKPVYVIGHRNPDTDSICSAIAYAEFKRLRGEETALAARCGPVNAETKYALEYFKMEPPKMASTRQGLSGETNPKARRRIIAGGNASP